MISKRYLHLFAVVLLLGVTACSAGAIGSGGGVSNTSSGGNNNVGSGSSGSSGPGLPSASYKQNLGEMTFNGCPPAGDGGDPYLNQHKNRVDNGNYQPTAFKTILNLAWPKEVERTAYDTWSSSAQTQVDKAEGLPVAVVGYLAGARQEGPETPNCHSSTDFDFHIWLLGGPGGMPDRASAIVVEATPRVRANHPQWTVSNLTAIAQAGTQVRISGWLMLDPEHPEQLGNTRGTLWEIHPIMQIQVLQNGQWVALDNGSVPQSKSTSLSGGKTSAASCPGLTYTCAQLTCDQATACLAAGNKALDSNGDGLACNSQCSK